MYALVVYTFIVCSVITTANNYSEVPSVTTWLSTIVVTVASGDKHNGGGSHFMIICKGERETTSIIYRPNKDSFIHGQTKCISHQQITYNSMYMAAKRAAETPEQ